MIFKKSDTPCINKNALHSFNKVFQLFVFDIDFNKNSKRGFDLGGHVSLGMKEETRESIVDPCRWRLLCPWEILRKERSSQALYQKGFQDFGYEEVFNETEKCLDVDTDGSPAVQPRTFLWLPANRKRPAVIHNDKHSNHNRGGLHSISNKNILTLTNQAGF